ncbi:MAG: sensor histidine kinase [Brachybacterium sp.]|nr:sensor histidine kinase [Brachybacterium sp.]
MTDVAIEPAAQARPFTPREVHRAAMGSGAVVFMAPSLLFLAFLVVPAWIQSPLPSALAVTALAVLFGAVFFYSGGIDEFADVVRWGWLAVSWLLIGALALFTGASVGYLVIFVVCMHAVVLSWRSSRIVVPLIVAAVLALSWAVGQPVMALLAVTGGVMAIGIGFGIQRQILTERLERAEQRNAVLAVSAERERIGRDLHDILGHSLTTITVSAQLARRLVDDDPEAAKAQLAEIERTSRQSLADVRTTASGLQQVRVATEVASSRSVLGAAGIEADVPASLPTLEDERAELMGYVVREAVTNVVRHSRATHCRITIGPQVVEVADDGVGIPEHAPRTGLEGLRRRVEAVGGTLVAERTATGGTLLRAELAEEDAR